MGTLQKWSDSVVNDLLDVQDRVEGRTEDPGKTGGVSHIRVGLRNWHIRNGLRRYVQYVVLHTTTDSLYCGPCGSER